MIDPRSVLVRDLLQRLGQPVESRRELLKLLDQFVLLLIPKKEFGALIAEALVSMPALDGIKSPAAARMAAAIVLSAIGEKDVERDDSDPLEWEAPKIPMIRARWLRRLNSSLLRVRIALEKSFSVTYSPLLDRLDRRLEQYLWTVQCAHRLAWSGEREMPPALAGVLTELIVESCVGLPGLAEQVVLTTLGMSRAEAMERRQLVQRLDRSIQAALVNDPAPNDLRHFRLQQELESLTSLLFPDDSAFVAPSRIVDPHEPPQFFEANLASSWFVAAAREAPSRLRHALTAA